MKKLIYLFSALLLTSFAVNAENIVESYDDAQTTNYRNYGKSFIFAEDGIEFSVFPDGQFDFNIRKYTSNVNISANVGGVSINYNSGYDYSAYLQYDEYGAIIQIENTYVDYDYYGRVNQIGNIRIRYDHANRISRIGGLNIYFNNYGRYDYCDGFINTYNRAYVYRPWHRFYILPPVNYCVIYNQPYRQYYTPIRYRYDRPYLNNYRRSTAVSSRRGNTVKRNRSYASRTDGRTRVTSTPRTRGNTTSSTPRTRGNSTSSTPRTRGNSTSSTPRTRGNTTTSNPRTRGNSTSSTSRSRGNTTSSTPRTSRNASTKTKTRTRNNTASTPTRSRNSSASTPRTRTSRTTQRSAPKTQKRVASTSRKNQSRASRPSSSPKRSSSRKKSSRR